MGFLWTSWKHLSSGLPSTVKFHPCLLKIYILLWWDIFSTLDMHHYPSVVPNHGCFHVSWKKHNPAEERMTVGCRHTAWCHVNTHSLIHREDFWSIAPSVHTDFILVHSLSAGFMIFGRNNETADCQRAVWCCIFVNISLPVLLSVRYDIPFWIVLQWFILLYL